jgi:hypothetical protein
MTKPDAVLRARLDAGTCITLVTSAGGNGYALFDDCPTEIVTSQQRAAGPSRCLREAELLLPLRVGSGCLAGLAALLITASKRRDRRSPRAA